MPKERPRYSSRDEEQIRDFLELTKSTRLQMDNVYYDEEKDVYVLVSHAFRHMDKAQAFMDKLESYFPNSIMTISQDNEGRCYIYWDIVELTDSSVKKMARENKVQLFASNPEYYCNKIKQDAIHVLNELKKTDMPLNDIYRCRADNAYYLISSYFSYEDTESCYAFLQKFRDEFGRDSADVHMDYIGRGFVVLDPGKLKMADFDIFVEQHKMQMFINDDEPEANDSITIEDRISKLLEDPSKLKEERSKEELAAIQVLNAVRNTKYPMDTIFKDEKTGKVMLSSAVFYHEENAVSYLNIYKIYFGSESASLVQDSQGRYFLYLDPACVGDPSLNDFVKDFKREIFPKDKHELMGKNRRPLRYRHSPRRIR